MIEIVKTDTHVIVSVKMKKRVTAKDKKIYFYEYEALKEARNKFPELDLMSDRENSTVVSNVFMPHEATWKFLIKVEEEKESREQEIAESPSEPEEQETKGLKIDHHHARLERLKRKHSSRKE